MKLLLSGLCICLITACVHITDGDSNAAYAVSLEELQGDYYREQVYRDSELYCRHLYIRNDTAFINIRGFKGLLSEDSLSFEIQSELSHTTESFLVTLRTPAEDGSYASNMVIGKNSALYTKSKKGVKTVDIRYSQPYASNGLYLCKN